MKDHINGRKVKLRMERKDIPVRDFFHVLNEEAKDIDIKKGMAKTEIGNSLDYRDMVIHWKFEKGKQVELDDHGNGRIQCSICLDEIQKGSWRSCHAFQLRCKHGFCFKCIYRWIILEGKLTCP